MSVANCRSFLGGSFGALCLIWPFPTRQPITLEEETRNLMKVAYAQIRENHYEAADATLHQILKLLTDAFHASHISPSEHSGRRARVFSELANLRLLQRNYTDAEKLFIETIRSSIAGGMDPDDACIVELSLKLSLIYDKLGDSEKALLGFKHCFEVQLKRMGELDQQSDLTEQEVNDIALFGLVSNAFAHFLIHEGKLKEAREKLVVALKSARRIYAPDHENCLHLLADLASLESQIGNFNAALDHLDEGIRLAEQHETSTAPLIRLFCMRAVIEGNRGEFASAADWLQKAHKKCSELGEQKEREALREEVQAVRKMIDAWDVEASV